MTVSQFFLILRARWLAFVLVLLCVVAAVVAASMAWPKRYTAVASVVVDSKPDPVSAILNPTLASPVFLATQAEILQSPRVAQRVVRDLKLDNDPSVRSQWQEATGGQVGVEEWLAQTFSQNLEVKPSREANVITVSYKAADGRVAATLANAFVQAYLQTSLDMRTVPARQYSAFFDQQLKEARDALRVAQERATAFQRDNGLVANDERMDVESQRLAELNSQFLAMTAINNESVSRQQQAQGRNSEQLQDVLVNPLVGSLKADIARAEAGLQGLTARLGDSHPQVHEARANLAELQRRLEVETRRVTSSVGVTATINQQRLSKVAAELEAQRARVVQIKGQRDTVQVLQRDVENAQRAYDAVAARLTQTSLESQSNQTNLYPLTQATVPLEPSSPRLMLNAALGVFGGALLGVLVSLGLEMRDRRLRSAQDLTEVLGLPMLGTLSDGRRRRPTLLPLRPVSSLPPPHRALS